MNLEAPLCDEPRRWRCEKAFRLGLTHLIFLICGQDTSHPKYVGWQLGDGVMRVSLEHCFYFWPAACHYLTMYIYGVSNTAC